VTDEGERPGGGLRCAAVPTGGGSEDSRFERRETRRPRSDFRFDRFAPSVGVVD